MEELFKGRIEEAFGNYAKFNVEVNGLSKQ